MLVHWIWLSTRIGLGDYNRKLLLDRFGSPEKVYFAPEEEVNGMDHIPPGARESLRDKDLSSSEKILNRCANSNIHILTLQDAAYPARLKNIPDPPAVLYYKGTLPEFDTLPVIGVVGTRKASVYGLTIAKRMGYQIASCGGALVSGIAEGIDALAMQGALTAGGTVVGVLGCGADIVYPPCNRALYGDTERYGCLLTEYPPGTPPYAHNFPRRNRIISGLSCGVLVVEAPEKSGALITAKRAADQGRDVFTVPANIDNPSGRGSNQLLRDGAIPVSCGWDILEEYIHQFPDRIRKSGMNARMTAYPDEVKTDPDEGKKDGVKVAQKPRKPSKAKPDREVKRKKVIDKSENEPYSDVNEEENTLTEDERIIVSLLRNGQKLVDDVIAESGKNAGTVLASLTLLEVKGIVRRLPGRFVELTGRK